jgi:TPR repeat protein
VPHAATRPAPKALDPEKLSKLSERCTSGDGHACLDAASAWEATGAPDDAARAKDHLKKAARIYINRCVGKDPVACAELAMLNASGRGVEKNERNASALRVHAQVLCRRHPKPECKDVLARAEAAPDVPASH